MPHLLEVYALALDAAAFGNSDRHSDNLEAEVARKRHLTPSGIMRAPQRLPDLSAQQHPTGPQSDLNLGIAVLVDSATSTVFDHTDNAAPVSLP